MNLCVSCNHIVNMHRNEEVRSSSLFDDLAIEILGQGESLQFRAHGNSMVPLIQNGDMVLVDPKKNEFSIGNIIFYRRSTRRYIIHRVVRLKRNSGSLILITKGDGMKELDEPTSLEQVMGMVVKIESRGKELRTDGKFGRIINRLLAYSSRINCPGNVMQRVLVKLWCLVSKKYTSRDVQRSPMGKMVA